MPIDDFIDISPYIIILGFGSINAIILFCVIKFLKKKEELNMKNILVYFFIDAGFFYCLSFFIFLIIMLIIK